jgi:hypothetical protein
MDDTTINRRDAYGNTALMVAAKNGYAGIAKTLICDLRTRWDTIVDSVNSVNRRWSAVDESKQAHVETLVVTELTRRQMCVIYPSTDPSLQPVPAAGSGPDDVPVTVAGDGDGDGDASCALLTSFFDSSLFDLNVLHIIREYVTYTV